MNAITRPAVLNTIPVATAVTTMTVPTATAAVPTSRPAKQMLPFTPSATVSTIQTVPSALASTPVTTIEPTPATRTTGSATEIATGTREASLSSVDDWARAPAVAVSAKAVAMATRLLRRAEGGFM